MDSDNVYLSTADLYGIYTALDKRNCFFLFLIKTICCDPSYEPSCQDGLDEGSQHIV